MARFAVIRSIKDEYVVRFLTWHATTDSAPGSKTTSSSESKPISSSESTTNKGPESNTTLSGITPSTTKAQKVKIYRSNLNDPLTITDKDEYVSDTIIKRQIIKNEFTIGRYFLIAKSDLDSNCVKVFATWINSATFTVGLVTMPMKLRIGKNFDFQGNLSIGTTAGAKMRISQYNPNYLNVLLGLSLATVSLDSFSTGGRISGQPLTNTAVFSPSLGAVLEFGKAQIGAFIGLDFLNKSTQNKYEWIYDKKPWLSIGFGFSIFAVDSKGSSSQNVKQTVPTSAPKE